MKPISDASKNMIKLLAVVIGTGDIREVDFTDWDGIFREMKSQDVHGLLSVIIDQLPITDEQRRQVEISIGKSIRTFHSLMYEQQEVLEILEDVGVPVIVLKGAAAAQNYPEPEYRRMGDIDLLPKKECFETAREAMLHAGYEISHLEEANPRHVGFRKKGGKEVELHRYFAISDDKESDAYLNTLLEAAFAYRKIVDVCGYAVPVLPTLENGLVLLSHVNQHLASGLGMRQILDWMMYVETCLDDEAWKRFSAEADKIGLEKLAVTATYMCKKYFGLRHEIHWCDGAEDELADELMAYVIDNGCFGKKIEKGKRQTLSVMMTFKNPIAGMKYLDRVGSIHMKEYGLSPVLRPFAAFYQIGRLAKKGFKRKVNLQTLAGEVKESRDTTEFLRRLGVTRL